MTALFRKKEGSVKKAKKGKRSIFSVFSALVPEHLGDFFTIVIVLVMAIGAYFFYQFAWRTTTDPLPGKPVKQVPIFSEDQLNEIIKILEEREEASTAPVVPPARDPFK